ncbi:hypothetical protein BG61_16675 [Caballeronia glathei]|uniref:Uncharacterized protein n=1 Tax=Caballeronia glathei TaxID=60547 RepID=A0A069PLP5_9BURK|nr:hypothetical protein BG61_16675 [Caballeronia glathei]
MPMQQIIPSYLYRQYSDDVNLRAFVDAYNSLSQGYLSWFTSTPLALYTSPNITGPLLDWIARGIYGIPRPVLSSSTTSRVAGYDAYAYNTMPYNGQKISSSGSAALASDDIYKRVMTWNLYRGDGKVFTIGWLKNRINRFLNGVNGTDWPVQNNPPSITVSGNIFSITVFSTPEAQALQQLFANNELAVPFQYVYQFVNVNLINNGGILQMTLPLNFPTSPDGLVPGALWYNGGVISVIPGVTPNPSAPPVFFSQTLTPQELLTLGGGNLPLTNPGDGTLQLWNDAGVISIA